jgi:hypothetical protein
MPLMVHCLFLAGAATVADRMMRFNSSAAIKHERNLPGIWQQVHGQCKDLFLRALRILLTPRAQRLPLPTQSVPQNVGGKVGKAALYKTMRE